MKAMKLCSIIFGLLLTSAVQASVVINEETFPDEDFRSVIANMPEGKDGMLTDEELAGLKQLYVKDYDHKIQSFQGLEYLSELEALEISLVYYTEELDLSKNPKLEFINIELGGFKYLNLSGLSSLKNCFIDGLPFLTEIDLSTCPSLKFLSFRNCNLMSLDLSNNTLLQTLDCNSNLITSLDLSNNINLKEVYLWNNKLSSLDLSNNIDLEALDCSNNLLTSLDLSRNAALRGLWCNNNSLEALDLSYNTMLIFLSCVYNGISDERMTSLVNSLPQATNGGQVFLEDRVYGSDSNKCTEEQKQIAIGKNWTVLRELPLVCAGGGGGHTLGVDAPQNVHSYPSGDYYTLDGRRINWQDRHRGIYIQNGKKVIVK